MIAGGFYYVEKTLLEGEQLPRPVHWFKWQAYTTWLSGVALLLVVYYLSDRAVLADPGVANLTHVHASLVGIGGILGGWALYEMMQRVVAPRAPALAAAVWITGLVAISFELTQLLSGRAAFLHVGAMLGTIMAGNVALTIVPSQRPRRGGQCSALGKGETRLHPQQLFHLPGDRVDGEQSLLLDIWASMELAASVSPLCCRRSSEARAQPPVDVPAVENGPRGSDRSERCRAIRVASRRKCDSTSCGRIDRARDVRGGTACDRSPLRGLSLDSPERSHIRRRAGGSDVRYAGADRRARSADS